MTDEQFPNNSKHAARPEDEARVQGAMELQNEVIIRKKGIGRKFKDIFFGGSFKASAQYVVAEVALPALRTMIVDTTSKGIERVIFGPGNAVARSRSTTNYGPRVQYNNPVARQSTMLPHQPPFLSRNARQDFGDIILSTREECENVLERLSDLIDKFKSASKQDLMVLLNQPSQYTDMKWGWGFLGNAEIIQVREGWLLDLPPMEPLV